MARPTVVTTQRDFSAGEVDVEGKRDETNPLVKAGARQASNGRILNSNGWQNRPGRRVLFKETGRCEKIQLGPSSVFWLCFGAGTLRVYSADGATQHFTESGRPWTNATAKDVVYAITDRQIVICFTSGVPRVLTWDGATGFTAANYAETLTAGNQKRTFFYRLSPKNITMQPAAQSGTGIAVTFSAGMNLSAGHVGTRMRFCNRQIVIASRISDTTGTINIIEPLPGSQLMQFAVGTDVRNTYNVGDPVRGSVTNSQALVTWVDFASRSIRVQLLTANSTVVTPGQGGGGGTFAFTGADVVVSPSGGMTPTSVSVINNPEPIGVWDDEVINSLRGYPQSVFADQGRLGFCNFPVLPGAVGWSAFGLPNDLYVDAPATAAIFELAPSSTQVYHVVPGPDGSEFVFGSNAVWRIPISATNPLKPGSVAFESVTQEGAANVQPRRAFEHLFYLSAGLTRVLAVVPTGTYSHPYSTRDLTEMRTHLFGAPIALAIPPSDGTFPERYAYVLNADGTVVCGKLTTVEGMVNIAGKIGWLPWSGGGTVAWIAALGADLAFTTSYAPNGIAAVSVVETLDDNRYLDGSMLYNTQPAGLPIPVGKGPLWWLAGGTVDLMDGPLGTRMMGTYVIDADGFVVPQGNAGEDLTSVNLRVGQTWTAWLEPFVPNAGAGQDAGQRMWTRRLQRVQVHVINSSGFCMVRLYGGQSGPNLPAPGTVMKLRRIPAWNQDEDPTQPPTLREQSYLDRPLGRSHDPRWAIFKDTPGPLTMAEIATKVSL